MLQSARPPFCPAMMSPLHVALWTGGMGESRGGGIVGPYAGNDTPVDPHPGGPPALEIIASDRTSPAVYGSGWDPFA